jgi:hypothetical protein
VEAQLQIRRTRLAVLSAAVLAVCGCTCTSDGLELNLPDTDSRAELSFEWRSIDAMAGTMTATAADGHAYSGPYRKITPDARSDQLAPLWEGWKDTRGWTSWRPENASAFMKVYDGMVLADLRTAHGERMRCRFELDFPSLGMSGGGAGKCQFPGGTTTDAVFSGGRAD